MSAKVVTIEGPFRGDLFYLVVDGCKVPYVHLYRRNDVPEEWTICIDDRFEADVYEEEIQRWRYVFANGLAVAAGYSHCGPESMPINRFALQMTGVDP